MCLFDPGAVVAEGIHQPIGWLLLLVLLVLLVLVVVVLFLLLFFSFL